jgi:hypothetical protein
MYGKILVFSTGLLSIRSWQDNFGRAVSAFVEAELVRKKSAHKMVLQKKSLVSKQFCTEAGATVKILQN